MPELTLSEIGEITRKVFLGHGCSTAQTDALVRTIVAAELDGAISHGMYRIPGYVASLRNGKVDGKASPVVETGLSAVIKVDGKRGFAPLALERGIPELASAAKDLGIAVMAVKRSHHFAALWPETEALAAEGLVAIACLSYLPTVAPAGATKPLYGTNPLSFAWPRQAADPMVFDMATSSMALGEVELAARNGRSVPPETGLGPRGEATVDPSRILEGVLLPFGGYKGSAISMMVELLAGAAIGEVFSFEAADEDNGDGGPPAGGEFIIALAPELIAGKGWQSHGERFFDKYLGLKGARLPGSKRHQIRKSPSASRFVSDQIYSDVVSLIDGARTCVN